MNYKIAIVEDDNQDKENLVQYLGDYSKGSKNITFTISCFSDAITFIEKYEPTYDIIFMDIELPKLNGMDATKKIREIDQNVCIIFVTNMAKYAVKGYEVSAFDFVVKPVSYYNFSMKLSRAINSLKLKKSYNMVITSKDNKICINTSHLLFVEVMKHSLVYHTLEGDFESYGTLKKVEETLNDKVFVRCNNCYLVNLQYVDSIEGNYAYLKKYKLLISYPRKAIFKKTLADYLCGGDE